MFFKICVVAAIVAGLFAFTPATTWVLDATGASIAPVYVELYALIAFLVISVVAIFALIIQGGTREPDGE